MKRLLTALLLSVTMGITTSLAATIQATEDGKYCLKNGPLTMTVDASRGGKILSFMYDTREIISQSRWPESFGSTFWTSPQKEWYWPPVPEYDKKPYQVEQADGSLVLTSEVSPKLNYRIRKTFSVDEQDQAFVVQYTIVNESGETRKVAPWEITRVPNDGGLIFFEAPVDSIWPAGLMNFQQAFGAAWYQPDEASENRKVNADGPGWLAYSSNGLLLVKRFADLAPSQPAPNEAEIQVYVNKGKTYIELESQGAYTTLQPGEQLTWAVRWYLLPCDADKQPSDALLQQVKRKIHGQNGQ